MNKKLINKPNILHTMYPYFWVIMIVLMLMPYIAMLAINGEIGMPTIDIVSNMIATFLISGPIFALIFGLIFRKDTSKYNKMKKALKYGKELEIKKIEYYLYDADTERELYYKNLNKYVFKIKYIDAKGNLSEDITEGYSIPVLRNVLDCSCNKKEVQVVLSKLHIEYKEYKGNNYLFLYADENVISEFKNTPATDVKQDKNITIVTELYNDNIVNNYIVNKLNSFLARKGLSVRLNQNEEITNKSKFDIMIVNFDFNKKDNYDSESILNIVKCDDSIEFLSEEITKKYSKDTNVDISIYVSNYSEEWEYYSLTIKVYY